MLVEVLGEGPEARMEREQMIVVRFGFQRVPRDTEEWLPGHQFEHEVAKTPHIGGLVRLPSENQLGRSKAEWDKGLRRRICKEVGCLRKHGSW